LPPEYQPERGPAKELSPRFYRTVVNYPTIEPSGTIIIDTANTYLYLTLGNGKAIRYGVGVGREGFTWSGTERISRMKEWPDWFPPKEMIARQPYLPRFMAGGETNPLGARAMYLGNTEYRIHGTNQPSTIGSFVSSGCVRLTNEDVEDLYRRVTVGTRVIVLPGANTATSQLHPRHKPRALRSPEETGPSRGVRGSNPEDKTAVNFSEVIFPTCLYDQQNATGGLPWSLESLVISGSNGHAPLILASARGSGSVVCHKRAGRQ
jgi:hypothetical protein